MDTPKEDGGAAFPIPDQRDAMGNGIVQGSDGMTLRDYFAAAAIHGVAHGSVDLDGESVDELATRTAIDAYKFADAMLSARKDKGA